MKFGSIPVSKAQGAVLAHAVMAGALRLKKAHRITADDVEALLRADVLSVVAAVLDTDDLNEDDAAAQVSAALGDPSIEVRGASTGRVNLHARHAGVFIVDRSAVDAINGIDSAVTLATLPPFARVSAGQMIATVKIIPFAVAGDVVRAVSQRAQQTPALRVAPFKPARVGLIQTERAGLKASVLEKTAVITQARLDHSNSRIVSQHRTAHHADALAQVMRGLLGSCDLILVFGASAVSDPYDVIPAAIRTARGTVDRVGMPVDPGNLLVLGSLEGVPVIGAPGCARSPRENGFDWVLDRVLAGLDITNQDIAGMGVGGLLGEISTRPAPREQPDAAPSGELLVHAVVLAAGRSSRMNGPNKLLARFDGEPLIRRVVERVGQGGVAGISVVVGHQDDLIREALVELPVSFIPNPRYAEGMATSLQSGVASAPPQAAGILVALGDMPEVSKADVARMVEAFQAENGIAIVRATSGGKRGNPVILPRACFAEIGQLHGDTGARALIESGLYPLVDVEIGQAASIDVDTQQAVEAAGGTLQQ